MAVNPYSALGVDTKATQDEIKAAYRKLAKQYHPDLNPGNKAAEERFKEISNAYSLIGSAEDRAKYEQEQERERMNAQAREAYERRGPYYYETQSGGGRYSNQFGGAGIDEDVLRSFFSRMGQDGAGGEAAPDFDFGSYGSSRARPANRDEVYRLEIDFKDSVLGAEREITLPSGQKFLVKIPAGVESGQKLRFAGRAEADAAGGAPGDVYVELVVRASSEFKRHARDLEIELPITLPEAILGGEIRVPTIDGSILMKIPANVRDGMKLRVAGKGVPNSKTGQRGDQFVVLRVKMPEKVDDEFRRAVEAWSQRQPYDVRTNRRTENAGAHA